MSPTAMSPKATTMIRMDHSHVLALFHRFKADSSIGKKRALVANACLALDVHAQLEEEIFYPALREVLAGDATLEKSEPEHNEMRRLISELRERLAEEGPIDGTAFDDKFMDLMRIVIHHVADEETRLLPAAERLMGDRLNQLGGEMIKRRVELLRPHVGELAASTMRSFPSAAAAGLLLTAGAVMVGAMLLTRRADTRLH
jgi:hemerythrin superfamily protein